MMQSTIGNGPKGRRGVPLWRAASAVVAVVCSLASVQAQVQSTVETAPAPRRARPLVYVEPTGPQTSILYATGEQRTHNTEIRWHTMCGSDDTGLTVEDLKRVADAHHAAMLDAEHMIVIDTPRSGASTRVSAFNVVFNMSTTNMPAGAPAAFALAETYLESKFSDPVTLTITVAWAPLGGSIIGQTGSAYRTGVSYTDSRAALIAGMDDNDTIQNSLPPGPTIPVRFDATAADVTDVSLIDWTSAAYRSTVGTSAGNVANMTYNSSFNFDFDPSNGVGGSRLSLVDTVVHEVGHSLGFTSAADSPDGVSINVLDIFRFARVDRAGLGNTHPGTLADFGTVAREVDFDNPGSDDSVSSVITGEWRMSDGNPYQASHFSQGSCSGSGATGILQPALCNGSTFYPEYFKTSDYTMFDAIGWDDTTCPKPFVTTAPVSQTICNGSPLSLSVAAANGTLSYQWRKNATNIPGATGTTYSLPTTSPANSGSYDVVITNSCGSTTSVAAVVDVSTGPTILTQPASQQMCVTSNAHFTVVVPSTPTPTYQWRKNSVNLPGQTAATLTISNAQVSDVGSYDCVITTSCGSTTSNAATLDLAELVQIVAQPQSQGVCAGAGVTFSVSATGSQITYDWQKAGIAIPGATGATFSIASVSPGDAGEYTCRVSGPCGYIDSDSAFLTVSNPPSFSLSPASQSVCSGANVLLTASATGSPAPTLQWRKNSVAIPGATGSSYSISSANAASAGTYDVVATNSCTSVASTAAVLTVDSGPVINQQPANATPCAGQPFSFAVAATGSPTFQWRRDNVNIPGATAATFGGVAIADDSATYDCVLTNSCGSTTSNPAALAVGSGPVFGAPPGDFVVATSSPLVITAVATGSPGITYQWRRNTIALSNTAPYSGVTTSSLTISAVSPAEVGDYDVVATNNCASNSSSISHVTLSSQCPADLDDGTGSGTPDGGVDINDLLYFLGAFEAGSVAADLDNGSGTGVPDGGVDINDLLFFLSHFELGC